MKIWHLSVFGSDDMITFAVLVKAVPILFYHLFSPVVTHFSPQLYHRGWKENCVSGQGTGRSCEPSLPHQKNVLNSNDAASTSACDSARAQTGEERAKWSCKWPKKEQGIKDKNDKGFQKLKLSRKAERVNGMWKLLSVAQLWFSGLRADTNHPQTRALWIEHCMNKPN